MPNLTHGEHTETEGVDSGHSGDTMGRRVFSSKAMSQFQHPQKSLLLTGLHLENFNPV